MFDYATRVLLYDEAGSNIFRDTASREGPRGMSREGPRGVSREGSRGLSREGSRGLSREGIRSSHGTKERQDCLAGLGMDDNDELR